MIKITSLYIPTSLNIIILNNTQFNLNSIILYNNTNYFFFYLNKKNYNLDLDVFCIHIYNQYLTNNVYFINNINSFLKTIESYFFIKIKFKGKGFKIKFFKKLKLVKFFFGRSHITFYKFKNIKLLRISKYKILIKNLNLSKIKMLARKITNIKPLNIFTQRGLRSSRQIVLKRKGKKGSYI